jgi:hypothetical protein
MGGAALVFDAMTYVWLQNNSRLIPRVFNRGGIPKRAPRIPTALHGQSDRMFRDAGFVAFDLGNQLVHRGRRSARSLNTGEEKNLLSWSRSCEGRSGREKANE